MYTYGTLEYYIAKRAEKDVIMESMLQNVRKSAESPEKMYVYCSAFKDAYEDWVKFNTKVGEMCDPFPEN